MMFLSLGDSRSKPFLAHNSAIAAQKASHRSILEAAPSQDTIAGQKLTCGEEGMDLWLAVLAGCHLALPHLTLHTKQVSSEFT